MKRKIVTSLNPIEGMISVELSEEVCRTIHNAALKITERRVKRRGGKGNKWQQGQFSNPSISTEIGFMGERALWEILSTYWTLDRPRFDVEDRPSKVDFEWPQCPLGTRHEVKTTYGSPNSGMNYVRDDVLHRCDVFWFLSTSDITTRVITLRGWLRSSEVTERGSRKPGKGDWINYLIPTESLNTFATFVALRTLRNTRPPTWIEFID